MMMLMEVQGSIYSLDLAALINLAEYLKVTETKYEGISRLAMTKLLCNFLDEKMAESESVEENATFLVDVKSFILRKVVPPPLNPPPPHCKAMGRKQLN